MNPELLGRNPGTRALAIRGSRSERGGPPETIGIERRVAAGCLAVVQIRSHQTSATTHPRSWRPTPSRYTPARNRPQYVVKSRGIYSRSVNCHEIVHDRR